MRREHFEEMRAIKETVSDLAGKPCLIHVGNWRLYRGLVQRGLVTWRRFGRSALREVRLTAKGEAVLNVVDHPWKKPG